MPPLTNGLLLFPGEEASSNERTACLWFMGQMEGDVSVTEHRREGGLVEAPNRISPWGLPYMTSAKFWDLLTPSPHPVTYRNQLLFGDPLPPPSADVIYGSSPTLRPFFAPLAHLTSRYSIEHSREERGRETDKLPFSKLKISMSQATGMFKRVDPRLRDPTS